MASLGLVKALVPLDMAWGSLGGARKVYCPVPLAFGLCYTVLLHQRVSTLRQSGWGKERSWYLLFPWLSSIASHQLPRVKACMCNKTSMRSRIKTQQKDLCMHFIRTKEIVAIDSPLTVQTWKLHSEDMLPNHNKITDSLLGMLTDFPQVKPTLELAPMRFLALLQYSWYRQIESLQKSTCLYFVYLIRPTMYFKFQAMERGKCEMCYCPANKIQIVTWLWQPGRVPVLQGVKAAKFCSAIA